MKRRLEQHESLDPLGVKRGKDRRQCSADRVSAKARAWLSRLQLDRIETVTDQPIGIVDEAEMLLFGTWLSPFDEKHSKTVPDAAENDARPGGEIPDVSAFDRRRHDHQDRPEMVAIRIGMEADTPLREHHS
jgi:hypothetical protein